MSLEFLTCGGAVSGGERPALARSPMERDALAAGARLEVRDGWSVAVRYDAANGAAASRVGWADVSFLGKLEVQGSREDVARVVAAVSGAPVAAPGSATRAEDAWWCPVWPEKALVLGAASVLLPRLEDAAAERAEGNVYVVDVTCAHAALTLVGPEAREAFARFTALDLRPASLPVGGFRPGSVARTPGYVLREDEERFLMLFGAALGHYVWQQVADAAGHLGGAPVGLDDLPSLTAASAREEVVTSA